jgi:hypothetical protein
MPKVVLTTSIDARQAAAFIDARFDLVFTISERVVGKPEVIDRPRGQVLVSSDYRPFKVMLYFSGNRVAQALWLLRVEEKWATLNP